MSGTLPRGLPHNAQRQERPVIAAVDPATTAGFAVGPAGGKPELYSLDFGDEEVEVFGRAVRETERLIEVYQPLLIAIEQPFFKADGKTTYDVTTRLHGLFGAICGIARARHIQVKPVAVRTWRATALGTSKFSNRTEAKQAMMLHCRRLGWPAPDDNAADAAGIHLWASATFFPFGVRRDDLGALLSAGGRR